MINDLLTTSKVLALLKKRGLSVSVNMIRQDIVDKYLPPPIWNRLSPNEEGRWEDWAYRRAVYLYRLRKRGVSGELLKVLLFYRDGWGWDNVQPICLAGVEKMVKLNAIPVKTHLRNPNPQSIAFVEPDILGDSSLEKRGLLLKKRLARFVWGVGFFGRSLAGGTIMEFHNTIRPLFTSKGDSLEKNDAFYIGMGLIAKAMIQDLGLSWEKITQLVKMADSQIANNARLSFRDHQRYLRDNFHAYFRNQSIKSQSTNLKTLFGSSKNDLASVLRSLPQRITQAQLLASCLAPFIVMVSIFSSAAIYESEIPTLDQNIRSGNWLEFLQKADSIALGIELRKIWNYLEQNASTRKQRGILKLLRPLFKNTISKIESKS